MLPVYNECRGKKEKLCEKKLNQNLLVDKKKGICMCTHQLGSVHLSLGSPSM